MCVTDALVEWLMSVRYEDLPPKAVEKVKLALTDSIACMVGGSQTEVGQAILRFLGPVREIGGAVVIGTNQRAFPRDAAFANATLANALDYDDTYEQKGKALCHPGATVVASALATSSMQPVSGRDVLTALAVGYEVSARVGESVQPSPDVYVKRWGLNHFMIFGSVAVASRLLRLDLETARHAFGIAGVAANLPSAWKWNWDNRNLPLSWQKDMVSWPAEAGLRAALLAQSGFRGCLDILDGDQGFWQMSGSDRFDPSRILVGLGEFDRLHNLAFKPFPCCRWIHSALEAFEEAFAESGLKPDEIATINVYTLHELANHFAVVNPRHMIDAEFSVPYAIAMVARNIPIGPRWHAAEVRSSAETREIACKVQVIGSDELDKDYFENFRIAARVVVQDKMGRTWQGECDQAKGGRDRPLTEGEHNAKFVELIDPLLGAGGAERVRSFAQSADAVANFYGGLEEILGI